MAFNCDASALRAARAGGGISRKAKLSKKEAAASQKLLPLLKRARASRKYLGLYRISQGLSERFVRASFGG